MHCANCGHEHVATEQAVRYTKGWYDGSLFIGIIHRNVVEETLLICSEPGCYCCDLSPTDAEDRIALIQAGEIDA